jgi:quercetin dioxygenase-like cupin family protein
VVTELPEDPTFQPVAIRAGLLLDLSDDEYPTHVYGWDGGAFDLPGDATHYGMATHGKTTLQTPQGAIELLPGMFFVQPRSGRIEAAEGGRGLVISRLGYRGLRQIGGPIEGAGRLRYIDGCSDTLLVCPPLLGEPCLNHLHIPPNTRQSEHTHPSTRLGIILRGHGECCTPRGVYSLSPGMAWHIPTGCLHAFATSKEPLDVIAWHPDSDFGPTHQHHPMVSRTYVGGVSASELPDIQTREITG